MAIGPKKLFSLIAPVIVVAAGFVYFFYWKPCSGYFADQDKGWGWGEKVESFANKVAMNNAIPGMAVAIVKDGEVIYSQTYGVGNVLRPNQVITSSSNFHLASISKALVAMAVLKNAEAGNLSLDKPVVEYYPEFSMADDRYKAITVRQILTHTSGIPDVEDYGWENPLVDSAALPEYISTLASKKLDFNPGEKWEYSNAAYDLLGVVLSRINGKSFEQYMKEDILMPLRMPGSSFYFPEIDSSLHMKGHTGKFNAVPVAYYPYTRAHAPSSTLQSNVSDVSQLVLNLLSIEAVPLLSKSSIAEMWRPTVKVH
ncbi:MAG: beta-lactamase family protein, partial [Flammeovirgaceae bacterium]|nr:beta-lactamase family protein [Flammeovirgaceae bacterium]